MIVFSKTMIATAALLAAGFVAADSMVANALKASTTPVAAQQGTQTIDFAALHLQAKGALQGLLEKQDAGKQSGQNTDAALRAHCGQQAWPYYSADCLVSSDGKAVRQPSRVIDRPAPAAAPTRVAANTLIVTR